MLNAKSSVYDAMEWCRPYTVQAVGDLKSTLRDRYFCECGVLSIHYFCCVALKVFTALFFDRD